MNVVSINRIVDFLQSWLAYKDRHDDIPGFSVAISSNDRLVFSNVYGKANIRRNIPLTKDHLFNVASQTKMITSVAIMQLAEKGKLALDDRIVQHLPWISEHPDENFRTITIRQLLCHRAGIARDAHDNDYWLFKVPFPDKKQLQQAILIANLIFTPGTAVKYSNLNFGLLGLIIEAVSGKPYAHYVKEAILIPAFQSQAVLDYSKKIEDRVPVGYGLPFKRNRPVIAPRRATRSLAPAAGLYANAEAMCRFVSALLADELINQTSKEEMFRTQAEVDHGYYQGVEFGLGMMIDTVGSHRLVGHDGHVGGHVTSTFFDPQEKLVVSVCTNAKDAPATRIVRGIFGVIDFFSQTDSPVKTPFDIRLINEMSTIEIVQNGKIFAAVDPDDWEPFSWYETLEKVNKTTLEVNTPGSIFNQGESAHYTFNNDKVTSVRFAGMTLWPDPEE